MNGTLTLRRTIAGVRIWVASGTHNRKVWRRLNDLLTQLGEHGQLGILRDVATRKVAPLSLLDQLRGRDIGTLPKRSLVPLEMAATAFVETFQASARHRIDVRNVLLRLARSKPGATVDDLPELMRIERTRCIREGIPATFNHARNYGRAFLKATTGRRSIAYQDVADLQPLRVEKKIDPHPCTPKEALAAALKLPELLRYIWVTLCLTGEMPDELWQRRAYIEPETRHVFIEGTKRPGRKRLVPYLSRILLEPPVSYKTFRVQLKEKTGLLPYDARRTYARWLEEAGVLPAHQAMYMGHGATRMTDAYKRGNVKPYLDEDAAKLLRYLRGKRGMGVKGWKAFTEGVD
jgi:hypothetical protein